MYLDFKHSEYESPTIQTFYFSPEKPMSFIPGQFIEITIPHENPDNRGMCRWFTISSSPSDKLLGITTRIVSDHSSYKNALTLLKSGNKVQASEPIGDFVLPKDITIPLVFVAGGIGITPYHSIAQWLSANQESRNIQILHAVNTEDDIIYQNIFDSARIPVTHIVSRPVSAWGGERGTLTANHILKLAKPTPETLIYLAGPEKMTEELTKNLHILGVPEKKLITDYFPGYTSY